MPYDSDSRRPSNRGGSQGGSGRGSSGPGGRSNSSRPSSGDSRGRTGRDSSDSRSFSDRPRDDRRDSDRPSRDFNDRSPSRDSRGSSDRPPSRDSRDSRGPSRSSDRPRFDDGRAPRSGARDRRPRDADRSGLMDYSRGRDGSQRPGRDDSRGSSDRPVSRDSRDSRDSRGASDRPRRDFNDRGDSRDSRGASDRPRRDFNDRGDSRDQGRSTDRPRRESFSDRPVSRDSRDSRDQGRSSDRPRREGFSDRPVSRDSRDSRDQGRTSDRPRREGFSEERPRRDFNDRGDSRDSRSSSDRTSRPASRDSRDSRSSSDRPRRDFNDRSAPRDSRDSRDSRSSGGPQRSRPIGRVDDRAGRRLSTTPEVIDMIDVSPEIDTKILPKQVLAELRNISPAAAEFAGRHLAAAMYALEDDDAERAFRHSIAARSRAARLACVREMCGLTAYHAQKWAEALSEFRTYQRLTGDPHFLPLMADCERGMGRPARALALARSEQIRSLDADTKIEMRIVASGARRDLGQLDAALATLECPELKSKSHSPAVTRLRYAYAEALLANGQKQEARDWFVKATLSDDDDLTDAAERATEIEVD